MSNYNAEAEVAICGIFQRQHPDRLFNDDLDCFDYSLCGIDVVLEEGRVSNQIMNTNNAKTGVATWAVKDKATKPEQIKPMTTGNSNGNSKVGMCFGYSKASSDAYSLCSKIKGYDQKKNNTTVNTVLGKTGVCAIGNTVLQHDDNTHGFGSGKKALKFLKAHNANEATTFNPKRIVTKITDLLVANTRRECSDDLYNQLSKKQREDICREWLKGFNIEEPPRSRDGCKWRWIQRTFLDAFNVHDEEECSIDEPDLCTYESDYITYDGSTWIDYRTPKAQCGDDAHFMQTSLDQIMDASYNPLWVVAKKYDISNNLNENCQRIVNDVHNKYLWRDVDKQLVFEDALKYREFIFNSRLNTDYIDFRVALEYLRKKKSIAYAQAGSFDPFGARKCINNVNKAATEMVDLTTNLSESITRVLSTLNSVVPVVRVVQWVIQFIQILRADSTFDKILAVTNLLFSLEIPTVLVSGCIEYFSKRLPTSEGRMSAEAQGFDTYDIASTAVSGIGVIITAAFFKCMPNFESLDKFSSNITSGLRNLSFADRGIQSLERLYNFLREKIDDIIAFCLGEQTDAFKLRQKLKDLPKKVSDWITAVDEANQVDNKDKLSYCVEAQNNVWKLRDQGVEMVKIMTENKAPPVVTKFISEYQRMLNLLCDRADKHKHATIRIDPMNITIHGPPNIGKSFMLQQIGHMIADVYNWPLEGRFYTRSKTKYWDEYKHQFIVLFDDFGQLDNDPNCDRKDYQDLMALKTNNAQPLDMAAVEDKGLPFTSKLILCATNVAYPRNNVAKIDALWRRRDVLVHAYPLPEYVDQFGTFQWDLVPTALRDNYGYLRFVFLNPTHEDIIADAGGMTWDEFGNELEQKVTSYYTKAEHSLEFLKNSKTAKFPSRRAVAQWGWFTKKEEVEEVEPNEMSIENILVDHLEMDCFKSITDYEVKTYCVNSMCAYVGLPALPFPLNDFRREDLEEEDKVLIDRFGLDNKNISRQLELIDIYISYLEKSGQWNRLTKALLLEKFADFPRFTRHIRHSWMAYNVQNTFNSWFGNYYAKVHNWCEEKLSAFFGSSVGSFLMALLKGVEIKLFLGLLIFGAKGAWNLLTKSGVSEQASGDCRTVKNIATPIVAESNDKSNEKSRSSIEMAGETLTVFGHEIARFLFGVPVLACIVSIDFVMGKTLIRGGLRDAYLEYERNHYGLSFPEFMSLLYPEMASAGVLQMYFHKEKSHEQKLEIIRNKKGVSEFKSGDNYTSKYSSNPVQAEGMEDPNAGQIARHRVVPYQWTIKSTEVSGNVAAYQIKGTLFLTVKHILSVPGDFEFIRHNTTLRVKRESLKYYEFPDVQKDLIVIDCGNVLPPGKDNTDLFVSEEHLSSLENQVAHLCCLSDEMPMLLTARMKRVASQKYVHLANGQEQTWLLQNGWSYNNSTFGGDCGSILIHCNRRISEKICGVHVAGIPDESCGFAELVTKEMIKSVVDSISTVVGMPFRSMVDIQPIEKCKVEPQGNFSIYGSVNGKQAVHLSTDTNIVKTPIFDKVVKHVTEPAILTTSDPRNVLKVSPIKKSVEKYGFISDSFDALEIKIAKDWLSNKVMNAPLHGPKRVLFPSEMINGALFDHFEPLNMKTSPGYPYIHDRHKVGTGKNYLFRGQPGTYEMKDPQLIERFNEREAAALCGERVSSIWMDCLKDERRKFAKIESVSTRTFTIPPIDFTLLCRKYTLAFTAHWMSNRFLLPHAQGIDPTGPEWSKLWMYFEEVSYRGFAGDFSSFDGKLMPSLIIAAYEIIAGWYGEHKQVYDVLASETIHTMQMCLNTLYATHTGNPSGNPLTTVLNSMVNIMYMYIVYRRLSIQHDANEITNFDQNIRLMVFGDDNICTVSEKAPWFNLSNVSTVFRQVGIDYGSAMKDGSEYGLKDIGELTFLKRGFNIQFGRKRVMCPIDENTIGELTNWIRKGPDPDKLFYDNLENALDEAFFYGKDYYQDFYNRLNVTLKSSGLNTISRHWDDLFLKWGAKFY